MNFVEINEINEMREQLATLKRQLNSQQIVNDRLLKEAMSNKLSTIQRRAIFLCVICFVAIPYTYLTFDYLGMSQNFCCATMILLAGALAYIWWEKSSLVNELNAEKEELTSKMIALLNDYASFILCQNVFHTIIENKSASLITREQLTHVWVYVFPYHHTVREI